MAAVEKSCKTCRHVTVERAPTNAHRHVVICGVHKREAVSVCNQYQQVKGTEAKR
jgi:hypothetical protein